jgi:hypothetical protein
VHDELAREQHERYGVCERHRGDAVTVKRGAFVLLAATLVVSRAHADARAEAAARQALTQARTQHAAHHYDRALTVLAAAEKACEPDRCSATLLAQLLRDIGTMQILDGDEEKGRSNFASALSFDSSIELNASYAVDDIRAIWNDVKSNGGAATHEQPSGDFDHTPAAEQKRDVPLPVYIEYHGSAHPSSLVVRYQGPGMTSFKRLKLARVGSGWGGVLPCGASKTGVLRYYFQGFDSDDLPILDGGDKRHPYTVPIRDSIQGRLPHLPGHRAPTMCGEGLDEETTSESTEPTTHPSTTAATAPRGFSRVWIGIAAGIDFTILPGGKDVCSRSTGGPPLDPNWACTSDTPVVDADFPSQAENPTLVPGQAGNVTSGVQPANVRVKVTLDYAITQNLLVGAAVGYVADAYQGGVGVHFPPIHLEARGTWVFGDEPLVHAGFAPFITLAAGVAEYDTNLTVTVAQNNIAGERPVQAWHVGGPGFVALASGARFAFSPRAAFSLGVRATLGFGTSTFPAFGPEIALQFGL